MTLLETHCTIVAAGLRAASLAVEAATTSVRTLRDEAKSDTAAKSDFRFASEQLDAAAAALANAASRLGMAEDLGINP